MSHRLPHASFAVLSFCTAIAAIVAASLMAPARAAAADDRAPATAASPGAAPAVPEPAPLGRMRGVGGYQRLLAQGDSLLKLRGGSHAENAQLYLSWGAPWGMKGARQTLTPACGDTTAVDTLYLSFFPGRPSDMFMGFSGELYFRTATHDTLGAWWHMESKTGENPGNVQVEFGPADDMPGVQPWTAAGQGLARITRTSDAMHLLLLYAVSVEAAGAIDSNRVYTLARVLVRHRRAAQLAGCGQPVCVEWVSGKFGFAIKDEPEVRRGERFVTYGGGATACDAARGPRVAPWKPGVKPKPK